VIAPALLILIALGIIFGRPAFSPTPEATPTNTVTATMRPTTPPTETATTTIAPTATITPTPTVTLPALDEVDCVPQDTSRMTGIVTNVINGDTIEVDINGEAFTVRYIGIAAPQKEGERYYTQAKEKNTELVLGQTVTLVRDQSDTDEESRLLRYLFVGDIFINFTLVNGGYALVELVPPDNSCYNILMQGQATAEAQAIGLHIPQGANCHPSYPTICIPPPPPDLDCGVDITAKGFPVLPPDPHGLDGDNDGLGCN
jgi:micrococcal nuclease